MLKTLAARIGVYKKEAILTPIFTMLEAAMEMLMPVMMAKIIDEGIGSGNIQNVYRYGILMIAMAALALTFGILAGRLAAKASTGFAANLRADMFRNIQTFSFANIDRYSTAGLVTRLTTDVTSLQNAFQMMTRMCIRAPMTMIFAIIMAVSVSGKMSLIFLAAMALLLVILLPVVIPATRNFRKVFKQYDALNASVQENVAGIRVVKAFVREEFEKSKFRKAAEDMYRAFVGSGRCMRKVHSLESDVHHGLPLFYRHHHDGYLQPKLQAEVQQKDAAGFHLYEPYRPSVYGFHQADHSGYSHRSSVHCSHSGLFVLGAVPAGSSQADPDHHCTGCFRRMRPLLCR